MVDFVQDCFYKMTSDDICDFSAFQDHVVNLCISFIKSSKHFKYVLVYIFGHGFVNSGNILSVYFRCIHPLTLNLPAFFIGTGAIGILNNAPYL